MKLERITVQAFRGYPSRAEVVLSGNVVLLSGENGTGKTSLTEAFEWALFGSVVRKERSKTRGEYQGSSWLRSVHAQPELETYAEITLIKEDQRHVVRRTLVGNATELTIDGQAASDVRVLGLRTEDAFRPFLGQCEIQALIDSEQQSRWEQLSAILGFAGFGQLRERLQRLRTDTDADARVRRLRERVTRAVQPLTPSGQDPLSQSPADLRRRAARFLSLAGDATWDIIRNTAQQELDALLAKDRRPPGLDVLVIGPRDLAARASQTRDRLNEFPAHAAQHRRWHEVNQRGSFATQGLALIAPSAPDVCPFCAHATLDQARIAALHSEATQTTAPAPADPRPGARDAMSGLLEAGPVNADAVLLLVEALGQSAETEILRAAEAEQLSLDRVRDRARRLAQGALAAFETASRPWGDDAALKGMVAELFAAIEEIEQRHAALRVQLDAASLQLTNRFSGLGEVEKKRMAALQMAVLLAENGSAVESAWRLESSSGSTQSPRHGARGCGEGAHDLGTEDP